MNIITQLVILTLSLLLVNADQYCENLLKQYNTFKTKCSPDLITINSCCDLTGFTLSRAPSAVYQIMTNCTCGSPFTAAADVYCDMNTTDGGWVVIQRNRKDSTLDFKTKNWIQYEEGFGDLNGDFWYGLEAIHCLTQTGQWEMRVDYQKLDKTWSYLHYNLFSVGSASEEYPLTVGGFTGIGDNEFALSQPLNGMKFSTLDNDNDQASITNCAAEYGGWWHNHCFRINPNRQPPDAGPFVLFIEMKIRSKDCITQ